MFVFLIENPFVERITPASVTVLEGEPLRLEFRIAINSNGFVWSEEGIQFTLPNGDFQMNTDSPPRRREVGGPPASPPPLPILTFSNTNPEFPQNYVLDFAAVSRFDAGVYTAFAFGE